VKLFGLQIGKEKIIEVKGQQDTLQNPELRLGDNSQAGQGYYTHDLYFTRNWIQLNALYRSNWLVKRIINLIANDMTREWTEFQSEISPVEIEKIQKYEKKLNVQSKVNLALKWARLYGGSIIYLDFGNTSDTSRPVNAEQVRIGGLKALHVIDRWRLIPSAQLVTDTTDPDFGLPESYIINVGNEQTKAGPVLHHSRVIRFIPNQLPWLESMREMHWSDSVMESVLNEVRKYDTVSDSIVELVIKAVLRFIKIPDLMSKIASKQWKSLLSAFNKLSEAANINNFSLIDKEHDLETQTYTFTGIPDTIQQFMTSVSGATEIPLVKLWGETFKGLNSTGDGEIRMYYDNIKTKQEEQMRDALEKLYSFLVPSALGDMPSDFSFDFKNLWQLSDKDVSEIVYRLAQSDQIYEGMGILDRKTIAKELRERGHYKNVTEEDLIEEIPEPKQPPLKEKENASAV